MYYTKQVYVAKHIHFSPDESLSSTRRTLLRRVISRTIRRDAVENVEKNRRYIFSTTSMPKSSKPF
jgi:hypothetical protein